MARLAKSDPCVPTLRYLNFAEVIRRKARVSLARTAHEASIRCRLQGTSTDCAGRLRRWFKYDFGPTVGPRIKLLVRFRTFRQLQSVRNDLRWLGTVMMNLFGQATVVRFDVSLTSTDLLTLEPERTEVESHFAFFRQVGCGVRILRHEDTHDTNTAGWLGGGDQVIHSLVIRFMTMLVAALITHALAATVSASAVSQIKDLLHGLRLCGVDRRRAQLGRQCQTVWMAVDNKYLRRAFDHRCMSCHQANGTCTVDGDALTR